MIYCKTNFGTLTGGEVQNMAERIAVAMSGGVDSSAAAWLLREQGHELMGITLTLFDDTTANVPGNQQDVDDAAHVAHQLRFPHHVLHMAQCFRTAVMDHFVSSYERGATPNPCVVCNRCIKFGALLEQAHALGAQSIATGHYARIEQDPASQRWLLKKAAHPEKDQSYVLCTLSQEQLSSARFPLGGLSKEEIRKIALEQGLVSARKRESQDICFIPDGDYAGFIKRETGAEFAPGNFVDTEGNILGQHKGIIHYTVGQRKGLGLTAPTPLFVKELRPDTNEVVICQSEQLFETECYVKEMNYMGMPELSMGQEVAAIGKVRYSHKGASCKLSLLEDGRVLCRFEEPQRAMTPGQAAVFYKDDYVLCGGTIDRKEFLYGKNL